MQIDLWERDNGWHDNHHLGSAVVQPAVDEERRAVFGSPTGWYHYELFYRVVKVG